MNWGSIYIDLINKAQNRKEIKESTEKHHSHPYHWFGLGTKKDFDWTIVKLTRREHFIAHKLLCLIYPDCKEAKMAIWRMMNTGKNRQKYNINSKDYERYKIDFSKSVIEYREDPIKDKKRRKICSESMKIRWTKGQFSGIVQDRKDPIKDSHRRSVCSEKMKLRNKNGLSEQTKNRNTNMGHMDSEQLSLMRDNQKKALSGKTQVVFLDGSNGLVDKEYYRQNKGKSCFHASSRKAAEILGKPYSGGRPKRKN
jgi:hypothetical protein